MSDWSEEDSARYAVLADVAVPRRHEMTLTLVASVPFGREEPFRIVELGAGDGRLAGALLDRFSAATLLALDGSESMRTAATARLERFGARAKVRPFRLDALDWWDVLLGLDLVVSSLCLHHLNDAKKQYLYKAVAERLSPRGVLLVAEPLAAATAVARRLAADEWDAAAREQADALGRPELYTQFVEGRWNRFQFPDADDCPSALFHHLMWLKHAGFGSVECPWVFAGHAVFCGTKEAGSRG